MKAFKLFYIPVILVGVLIYSCDKIDPPYVKPGVADTLPIKSGDTVKNVLLEDYTGHGCVNCPAAAETGHVLKDSVYGQRLIIVAVHAGFFASPQFFGPLFSYDFNTEAGTAWDNFYSISTTHGNPNGLVDRTEFQGITVLSPAKWDQAVESRIQSDFLAKIAIQTNFNSGTRMLSANIKTEFQDDLPGSYTLLACIVQDSIVAPQKDENLESGVDTTYVHMNALRGSMNGNWGENLAAQGTVVKGQVYEKDYSITFADDWVPENCRVVAFVFDEATNEVIQVDEEMVR